MSLVDTSNEPPLPTSVLVLSGAAMGACEASFKTTMSPVPL